METIYVEFMEELKILLKEVENSWWNQWIQKSIDKYKINQDVSYYLSAFGGMGSFNDEVITCEATEVLKSITGDMAHQIKNQGCFILNDILQETRVRLGQMVEDAKRPDDYWNKENNIKYYTNMLKYLNCVIENYSVGNLHQITNAYLEQKDIKNSRLK